MCHVTKNYSADGGDTLVIGGKLVVEEGAEVSGLPDSGGSGGAAANQPASTATQVAALKNDFNALLIRLKDAGIMVPDAWNVHAGLAPAPTEDVLVSNNGKVKSVTDSDGRTTSFTYGSMASDSVATNFEQIFATYSPGTVRKVL